LSSFAATRLFLRLFLIRRPCFLWHFKGRGRGCPEVKYYDRTSASARQIWQPWLVPHKLGSTKKFRSVVFSFVEMADKITRRADSIVRPHDLTCFLTIELPSSMRIDVSRKDVHKSVKRCVQFKMSTRHCWHCYAQSCPVVKMGEW
jgi:hypothetical protein